MRSLTSKIHRIVLTLVIVCPIVSNAQVSNYDSLINSILYEDSILLDELSSHEGSILDLIDSLVNAKETGSSLSLRLGYTSNIATAGRDFGFEQYGLGAGLTYYHKKGPYLDVSGYWNSEIEPNYNPTIISIGYMGSIKNNFNCFVSFDKYLYNESNADADFVISYPLTNSLSASGFYDVKFITLGAEYAYLFGDENTHRVRGNLIGNIRFYTKGFVKSISILPTATIMAGNQYIYTLNQNYQFRRDEFIEYLEDKYGREQLQDLHKYRRRLFNALVLAEAVDFVDVNYEEISENVFGVMNYSFSLPIILYAGKFSFSLSYTYNIPVALEGETVQYDNNSYFSSTLIFNIPFKKK